MIFQKKQWNSEDTVRILQSIERVYSNLEIKFNENTPQSYKLNKDILKTNLLPVELQ